MESKRRPRADRGPQGSGVSGPQRQTASGVATLDPGLYLVATPIGNAADITLRALDVLTRADALAAEDTRQVRKLMDIHGIPLSGRPLVPYHDRNGAEMRPKIARWLSDGMAVAYCSDAGSPLIADPGYRLARLAIEDGHPLTAVPGPSAVIAALTLSGLPSDRFLFAGFLAPKQAARRRDLAELAQVPATLVFFESPRRLAASLADMADTLGATRSAAVARELTKRFEEVRRASLGELAAAYGSETAPKGEIVVLVGPPDGGPEADPADLDAALRTALTRGSVKDAAREVSTALGLSRREVYARAVEIAVEGRD